MKVLHTATSRHPLLVTIILVLVVSPAARPWLRDGPATALPGAQGPEEVHEAEEYGMLWNPGASGA